MIQLNTAHTFTVASVIYHLRFRISYLQSVSKAELVIWKYLKCHAIYCYILNCATYIERQQHNAKIHHIIWGNEGAWNSSEYNEELDGDIFYQTLF